MTPLVKLAALGSGSLATASVVWIVATSTGHGGGSQAGTANKAEEGLLVCAGQDAVLRLIENANSCPNEQTRVELEEAEEEPLDWDADGLEEEPPKSGSESAAVTELERRVAGSSGARSSRSSTKRANRSFVSRQEALWSSTVRPRRSPRCAPRQTAASLPDDRRRTTSQLRSVHRACEAVSASPRAESHVPRLASWHRETTR